MITSSVSIQNQHIMGWGAMNPEPSPGVYDWSSLDNRVNLMRQTDSEMILTLCGAPDWMKGGTAGSTDWSKLEVAPLASHYDDFAALAVQVAKRYPDVTNFSVWNELKGFWNSSANTWDIQSYTTMYNKVYTALKAYNPNLKIGGPYVVADSWSATSVMSNPSSKAGQRVQGNWGVLDGRVIDVIDYWLANKAGADFISLDGGIHTRDKGLITDAVSATAKFAAIDNMIRAKTSLPIWWMETYARASNTGWNTNASDWSSTPTVLNAALTQLKNSGAAVALLWDPQGNDSVSIDQCDNCLWTDTRNTGGGQRTAFADVVAAFKN